MAFIDNGDLNLSVRTKLNALAELLQVGTTNEAILAGVTTSVFDVRDYKATIASGEKLYIISIDSGEVNGITLDANSTSGDLTITILGIDPPNEIPKDSLIIYPITSIINRLA